MIAESDLKQALLAASGLPGEDGMCLSLATAEIVQLLAANWAKIKNVSDDPEAEGQVKVAVGILLDFSGKTPCGSITVSFSQKYKEDATFRVEDKDQRKLFTEN